MVQLISVSVSQSQLNTDILCLNQTPWEHFRAQVQRKHCRLLVVEGVVHFLQITCSTYVQGSAALNPSLASSLISLLFWQRNGHVHLVNEETLVSRVMCCQDCRASVCPSACVLHWWRTETLWDLWWWVSHGSQEVKMRNKSSGCCGGTVKGVILLYQKELLSLCFCPWSNLRIKSKTRWHLPWAPPFFMQTPGLLMLCDLRFDFHCCVSARHLVFVVQPLKENDILGVSPRPSRAATGLEHQTVLLCYAFTRHQINAKPTWQTRGPMNYKTQWNKLEFYVLIWAKEPSHGASGQSWF